MWPARWYEIPSQAKTGPIFHISICNGSSSIYQIIWTFLQALASYHCQNLLTITCNEQGKQPVKQLEPQIAEDPILAWFLVLKVEFLILLLEGKILWDMDAVAFQGIVGKSFYLLPSCHRWSQYFDGDGEETYLALVSMQEKWDKRVLPWWRVKAAQLEAPHQALLSSVGVRGSNRNYLLMTQHLQIGMPGPSHTGSFSVADESNSHGLWR